MIIDFFIYDNAQVLAEAIETQLGLIRQRQFDLDYRDCKKEKALVALLVLQAKLAYQ